MLDRLTSDDLRRRKGGAPPGRIVAVTAYDAPTARLAEEAGADLILVGDSLGPVVLGFPGTRGVTMDDMLRHTAAAARGLGLGPGGVASRSPGGRALLVADMPYGSCATPEAAAANARRLAEAGAAAVKPEWREAHPRSTEAIAAAGIPVLGHIGLNPQSVPDGGAYRVQGRTEGEAEAIFADARSAEAAGSFALVVEAVPASLGARITAALAIPTIGIGAGPACDGQILVLHDLLGIPTRPGGKAPRFVRPYADIAGAIRDAIARYAADVRAGAFPAEAETYR